MANKPLDLTVYSREGCHLCDAMIEEIREFQAGVEFKLEIIDVDDDEALRLRYGSLVPVLMAEGREICHYFFDTAALETVFKNTWPAKSKK